MLTNLLLRKAGFSGDRVMRALTASDDRLRDRSRVPLAASLVAQCLQRIHVRRPPRRQIAG
jgi:hypothetical protein